MKSATSSKKTWIRPEITGVSIMGEAQTIENKQYFTQEGTYDGSTYIGPAS